MIGHDANATAKFVAACRDAVDFDSLTSEARLQFDELIGTALLPQFPGALLAYPQQNEATIYYAISASAAEWRRLRPLLIAFAGPTLTSFNGWPEPFLPDSPLEIFLLSGDWHIVVRLVPGDAPRVRQMLQRSLSRMLRTIASAPITTYLAPQPTSRLLSNFVDCLNGNDRSGAERILEICQSELRVDALNLSFLRIQLLGHFCDWRAIREMPEFNSLCYTRKSPLVTQALLESLYQGHASVLNPGETFDSKHAYWRDEVRPLARSLIRLPIPRDYPAGALRLYALEALSADPRRPDLEAAVLAHRTAIGELADALDQSGRNGLTTSTTRGTALIDTTAQSSIGDAQRALVTAETVDTLATFAEAFVQLAGLDEQRRKELLQSEPFRSVWQNLRVESGGISPPTGWIEWLRRLSEPEFTSAFSVLKRAVVEWPASALEDPAEILALANAIGAVPDVAPANERIADALPLLVSWAAEDPHFPRPAMMPVYETLLFHLVVGARRAATVLDSATLLIRALLTIGLPVTQYRALLDDCIELAGGGVGIRNVYWLLDLLEETILNPAPSPEHRQAFWYAVHARLMSLRSHLSPGQRLAVSRLATTLGWQANEIEPFAMPEKSDLLDQLHICLSGKNIAIYSLTESAARQAAQAIAAIAPEAKVTLSSDTCGTAALKSIAQNSDIFVVATASAKHAATGFIQQMRPREKPLLFAAGRGFTSIVRAIEDFVLGSAVV